MCELGELATHWMSVHEKHHSIIQALKYCPGINENELILVSSAFG